MEGATRDAPGPAGRGPGRRGARTPLARVARMQTELLPFERAESTVAAAVGWLRLGVEVVGAAVVAIGVVVGLVTFARAALARRHAEAYPGVRLILARYLAVALEFQLAADILSTAIAPSWDALGRLAATAVIRTGLNYSLGREMREESARMEAAGAPDEARRRALGAHDPG
jgi:uncharacterized membrane protein